MAWLAVAALLSTGAGMALVRAGSLEHQVFQGSARIAVGCVLLGAALQHIEWHARPAAALLERIDLTPLSRARGAVDFQELALCIASGKLIAAHATRATPACVERPGRGSPLMADRRIPS